MPFLIIVDVDNSIASGPVDEKPDPLPDGTRAEETPLTFGTEMVWSQDRGGFVAAMTSAPTMLPVADFMLLFTQAERISLRAARSSDATVEDFWELMTACTGGISLQHPMVVAGVQHLATAGLITAERATAILAGTPPSP